MVATVKALKKQFPPLLFAEIVHCLVGHETNTVVCPTSDCVIIILSHFLIFQYTK